MLSNHLGTTTIIANIQQYQTLQHIVDVCIVRVDSSRVRFYSLESKTTVSYQYHDYHQWMNTISCTTTIMILSETLNSCCDRYWYYYNKLDRMKVMEIKWMTMIFCRGGVVFMLNVYCMHSNRIENQIKSNQIECRREPVLYEANISTVLIIIPTVV